MTMTMMTMTTATAATTDRTSDATPLLSQTILAVDDIAAATATDSSSRNNKNKNRKLATLTLSDEKDNDENEKEKIDAEEEEVASSSYYVYQPSDIVTHLHHAPRGIRHSNRFASFVLLFSSSSSVSSSSSFQSYFIIQNEYTDGVKNFMGMFVITPILIWTILLLLFKFVYGKKKKKDNGCCQKVKGVVSGRTSTCFDRYRRGSNNTRNTTTCCLNRCLDSSSERDNDNKDEGKDDNKNNLASPVPIIITNWLAGGDVIDMIELSKAGIARPVRKQYVLRSWRIQSVYMIIAIFIPVLSIVLLEMGWKTVESSVQQLQTLNGDVETLAYRGWNAVENIDSTTHALLTNNTLIQLLVEYNNKNNNNQNEDNINEEEDELDRKSHDRVYVPTNNRERTDHENDDNHVIVDNTDSDDYDNTNNEPANGHHGNDDVRNLQQQQPFKQKQQQQQQETEVPTTTTTVHPKIIDDFNPWHDIFGDSSTYYPSTATYYPTMYTTLAATTTSTTTTTMATTIGTATATATNTATDNSRNDTIPTSTVFNNKNNNLGNSTGTAGDDSTISTSSSLTATLSPVGIIPLPPKKGATVTVSTNNENNTSTNLDTNTARDGTKPMSSSSLESSASASALPLPIPIIPTTTGNTLLDEWCPNAVHYISAEELSVWAESLTILSDNIQSMNNQNSMLHSENSRSTTNSTSTSSTASSSTRSTHNTNSYSTFFRVVTETTNSVDEMMEWFLHNDWVVKLFLLILNVVNGLLLANVYIVSKNNIIHEPTRMYVGYILLPLFVGATLSMVVLCLFSGIAVLLNVDFCSGDGTSSSSSNNDSNSSEGENIGSGGSSPQGTIEDIIIILQQQQQQQSSFVDGDNNGDNNNNDAAVAVAALDVAYDAVGYFWTGCLTENPLQFLDDFSNDIDKAAAQINQFTKILPIIPTPTTTTTTTTATTAIVSGQYQQQQQQIAVSSGSTENQTSSSSSSYSPADSNTTTSNKTSNTTTTITTLDKLNIVCQRDMSFLPHAIDDLKVQIDRMKVNIHKLSDTVSCGQISPLLRRVSHGSICVESPYSLTIVWGTSFGLALLCFILLTLRAALFNSVRQKKRRPTKPRRIVEKEFEEYKEFMNRNHYYDLKETSEWKIDGDDIFIDDPKPTRRVKFEFDPDLLETKRTFDTTRTTKEGSAVDSRGRYDNDDDGSDNGGIHICDANDDSSYGSSYDSEISDDDVDDDGSDSLGDDNDENKDDDHSSVIGSLMSDVTKSSAAASALQMIHSFRTVTSLLLSSSKNNAVRKRSTTMHLPQEHPLGMNDGVVDGNVADYFDDDDDDDDDYTFVQHEPISDILVFPPKKNDTAIGDTDNTNANDNNDNYDDKYAFDNVSISEESLYLPTTAATTRTTPYNSSIFHNEAKKSQQQQPYCLDAYSSENLSRRRQDVAASTYRSYTTRDDEHSIKQGDDEPVTATSGNMAQDTNSRSRTSRTLHDTPTITRIIEALTPSSSVISALSPMAPRKAFSFLARTKATVYGGEDEDIFSDENIFLDEENYTEEELNSLVQPKQLSKLTPFRSHTKRTDDRTHNDDIISSSTIRSTQKKEIQPTKYNYHLNNKHHRTINSIHHFSGSETEPTASHLLHRPNSSSLSKNDSNIIDEKRNLLCEPSTLPSTSHVRHSDARKIRNYHHRDTSITHNDSTTSRTNNNDNTHDLISKFELMATKPKSNTSKPNNHYSYSGRKF